MTQRRPIRMARPSGSPTQTRTQSPAQTPAQTPAQPPAQTPAQTPVLTLAETPALTPALTLAPTTALSVAVGAALALAVALAAMPAVAGPADVIAAEATRSGDTWRFSATVAHGDTGWEHYADAWRVVGPDGTVYGVRELAHPHVDEQPFTRSLSGVAIPEGVDTVRVEARDSVHGWGGAGVDVTLPR